MRDVEIPDWLKGLPLAPEFRPTDTEFADPIAYISKIEKEASAFGICKVIPPLPKPSKKYVVSNLNKSLSKCPELGPDVKLADVCSSSRTDSGNEANGVDVRAVFTTRQQELGQSAKPTKKAVQPQPPAVCKQVWQSGEAYTLEQFESKSKAFARSQLGMVKDLSPLVIEALFWKAASEKPICVEYANDVPGSGFGEPEGSFRYFHRRRRRRGTFNRNSGGSCVSRKYHIGNMSNADENKGASLKNSPNSSGEISKVSICLPTTSSNPGPQFSRQTSSNATKEMEGTAGWKLSNSPWNLQVIARSPGSLTRFMPDDIPGVTSPMVYVGMLFSWFAWHVEDHELHSLNFLHTGSPKTWYAVPGDYAFAFEEVIHNQAYGGTIDRLAALTLLGEKTTLMSPQVIVESGIPCCRLIQNPGEFVVTFPRAYHIGFSHGFNCGEAANFGTSKWLKVAKEAAVRRAAMNYLPMLSHQQLLYLLTMSFISRVPRSLLPGARSSRLRDRLKDERELSVKKAFIEDILTENNLLTILLGKHSSYHVVLWDVESLPSPTKESGLCSTVATAVTTPGEEVCSENKNHQDLLREMSLYMETVNDLYVQDDDLSCDFQVDSGTLACVACGILGFPFMSVVQPSEKALKLLQEVGMSKPVESDSPPVLNIIAEGFGSDGLDEKIEQSEDNLSHHQNEASSNAKSIKSMISSSEDLSTVPELSPCPKDLPATRGFLRPRIFCLEHAIQIEEMLHSKGGANILVICHSDFQKIKAQAAAISEEIGCPFACNEIPLDEASQEDLNLIDLAIDDEEHDEAGEDWTSKLSINLRYCVKVRKSSSSKKVQHALALGGLFSDRTPSSNNFYKWSSTRSRSKRNLNHSVHAKQSEGVQLENPVQMKPSECVQIEKVEVRGAKSDGSIVREEGTLIQYSRRSFKSKAGGSVLAASKTYGHPAKLLQDEVSVANCGDQDENNKTIFSNILLDIENTEKKSSGSLGVSSSYGKSELHSDAVLVADRDLSENSVPSQRIIGETVSDSTRRDDSEMQDGIKVDKGSRQNEKLHAEKSPGSLFIAVKSTENFEVHRERENLEDISMTNVGHAHNSEGQHSIESDGDALMKEASALVNSAPCCEDELVMRSSNTQSKQILVEKQEDIASINGCKEKEPVLKPAAPLDQYGTVVSTEESLDDPMKMNATGEIQSCENCCSPGKGELERTARSGSKRRRAPELQSNVQFDLFDSFIKSPCEGLRPRAVKDATRGGLDCNKVSEMKLEAKKTKPSDGCLPHKRENKRKGSHRCDLEGCRMSFQTKSDLLLHKRNRCPHEGCGKKFSSHKYAVLHQRVHDDDRPLKCTWKGCTMTFKWAWARTEHLRVHTGERPYQCKVEGCGLTFRFVSDYSRHRRKTGHYANSST